MRFLRTWRFRTVTLLSVLSLVGLIAGCSDSPTDTTNGGSNVAEMSMNLALPDGGTGTHAEAPYFGDPYFATYLNENIDADVQDPTLSSTRMSPIQAERVASSAGISGVLPSDLYLCRYCIANCVSPADGTLP